MNENFGGFENKKEDIPSEEEVTKFLVDLIGERKFKITQSFGDEKGLYFLEARIENEEGMIEYEFMRKGRFGKKKSLSSNVSVAFYNKDGMPEGGEIIARYENGKWNLTT